MFNIEDEYRKRYRQAYAKQKQRSILMGKAFYHYLEKLSDRYCIKRKAKVNLIYETHLERVAWTDGREIYINAANPLTKAFSSLEMKATSITGLLFHEIGHVNYSDCDKRVLYGEGIREGILYPCLPNARTRKEEAALEELKACLEKKDQNEIGVIYDAALDLHNILEDIYIEARMCAQFGGIVKQSLFTCRQRETETTISVSRMMQKGLSEWCIMRNVILQYLSCGQVNDWEGDGKMYLEQLKNCQDIIDRAVVSTDVDARFKASNQILLKLWPMIMQEFIDQNRKKRERPEYEGTCRKKKWENTCGADDPGLKVKISEAMEALQKGGSDEKHAETIRAVNKIRKDIADEAAKESIEGEIARLAEQKVRETDFTQAHAGVEINVTRMSVEQDGIRKYERLKTDVQESVGRMIYRLEPVLMRCQDRPERGMPHGKRIDTKHLYRQDHRIFRNRNKPGETKNTVIAIMLDESGSMEGERIVWGRMLALIIYEFCQRMGIPILIAGHSTMLHGDNAQSVEIYTYAEFDSIDQKDRYRLMGIQARGNSRDGAVLRYVGARLEERTEKQKILFVVTDGNPLALGYAGETAHNDVRKTKKELEKKGICVVAAAIGDDREDIRNIYGESFLNISDLKRLPDTVAALIAGSMER